MGVYLSVRGWLECVDDQERLVWDIVRRHDDDFYSRGWSTLSGPNGDTCVFYCGTIREQATEWFLGKLRDIARIPPPADPADLVRGLFLAHHEQHGMQEWQLRDGGLFVASTGGRYDYLAA
ncbi:hypothetical protein V6U90_32300 [Micromonospora sp. CPCC 206060]|uniref:hypothetical protein n=1 Tax=Micromonospora sp. CPCC 206060 TaxID=3122406 RepID=UPI002FF1CB9C